MNELPKVASNIYIECKKCGQERYHKVLTHVNEASMKVECEVCHGKRTYKMSEGKDKLKNKPKATAKNTEKNTEKNTDVDVASDSNEAIKPAKVAKPRKSSKRAPKGPSQIEIQNAKFKELFEKYSAAKSQPYRMANVYSVDTKIEHPKFGVGFVSSSLPDKIEVVFEDVNRNLVQGRK